MNVSWKLIFVGSSEHANMEREKGHWCFKCTERARGNWRKMIMEDIVHTRELVSQCQIVSDKKTYIKITLYKLNSLYLITHLCLWINIYYIYMHSIKISEKDKLWIWRRAGKGKWEGLKNEKKMINIIIFSKIHIQKISL